MPPLWWELLSGFPHPAPPLREVLGVGGWEREGRRLGVGICGRKGKQFLQTGCVRLYRISFLGLFLDGNICLLAPGPTHNGSSPPAAC